MHLGRPFIGAACALFLATLVSGSPGRAEDPALEAYMPDNVIGCLRVRGVRARLDELLRSSALEELKSLDLLRQALTQGGGQELQKGLAEFQAATGKDFIQVAADLLGKEALIGVRFQFSGPEFLIVARGSGEKEVEEGLAALRTAAEKKLGRPLEREETTHGDAKIELYEKGKLCIARKGAFIAASNSKSGIETLLDLGAKKSGSSIEGAPFFKKGSAAGKEAFALLVIRPSFIPNFQAKEKLDEAGESLLFGGFAKALNASDVISAALDVTGGKLQLSAAIHAKNGEKDKHGTTFFPPTSEGAELAARLRARGAVAFLHLRRDLSRWWEAREEIMSERAAGGLLEFGNTMNQLFGKNFQDEVLPEIGPDVTFFARNQEYADLSEKPKPAIPGFALVFELKSSKTLGKKIVSAFQALIAIINIDRAQKKKDEGMSMLVRTEKIGKYDLHTVSLVDDEGPPGVMHNFTPSLAVAGSKVILSSSAELAKLFLDEVEAKSTTAGGTAKPTGDTLTIDGAAVRKILGENHEFLISDNMVKKGHTKEEAEKEIGILYAILDRLRALELRSWKDDDAVRIRLDLGTKWDGSEGSKTSVKKAETGVRL